MGDIRNKLPCDIQKRLVMLMDVPCIKRFCRPFKVRCQPADPVRANAEARPLDAMNGYFVGVQFVRDCF
jgi:hypothetical protein